MSPVTFPLAFFLGVFSETLLVGLLIPLLIVAVYAQWKKVSTGRKVNKAMAFGTAFFGLSIVSHWVLGLREAISAALYLPPGMTTDQYLLPPFSVDQLARVAIFQFQIVVADAIMVYRMYHIYEKSFLACVIPSITTAGLLAIGCGLVNQLRNLNTPADYKANNAWIAACFSVTLFNSAFTSVAISIRLWKVHRETAASGAVTGGSVIVRAMWVLVESAALWTLSVAINLFMFLGKSNLQYTFLDVTGPVMGISFCMIIVRLGTITPEVREDSWQSSQRTQASRMQSAYDSRFSRLTVPLDRVKVERDVFVCESASDAMQPHPMSPASPGEKFSVIYRVE